MITDIEDFFSKGCGRCERFATSACSANQWHTGLTGLRALCRSAGLVETVKWGHPCYMHAGRNIALIGALQGDFRLNFFNAALMKDPDGLLERQGPNTQHPDSIRFTASTQVEERAASIRAYLLEAMGYADAASFRRRCRRHWNCPTNWSMRWTRTPSWPRRFTRSPRAASAAT